MHFDKMPDPQLCFEADHSGTVDVSDTDSGVGFTDDCEGRSSTSKAHFAARIFKLLVTA
jgi:hypothetical protein